MSPIPQGRKRSVNVSSVDVKELAQALKEAIQETAPIQQVHISRYVAKTPFNPTGSKTRPKLRGLFLQNGGRMVEDRLTNDEITLLNKIRPGRYLDRRVEVIERTENGETSVEIRYSNASMEQRLELKNRARNLKEMLQGILDEQKPSKEEKAS